jgi:hypothetical protein
LKNGGMLRGTISEMAPNDYVVIVTVTGESKRLAMSDVQYAGPAAEQPRSYPEPEAAPAPPAKPAPKRVDDDDDVKPEITLHAEEARLKLTSDPPGQTFHKRTSSAVVTSGSARAEGQGYREICTTPCEVSIGAGTYTFGVSSPGESPVASEPVTVPAGHSELHASYNDKSGVRTAGTVILTAGALVGGGLMVAAFAGDEMSTGLLYAGTGVFCGGFLIGYSLVRVQDSAEVEVRQAHGEPARHDTLRAGETRGAHGIGISGLF